MESPESLVIPKSACELVILSDKVPFEAELKIYMSKICRYNFQTEIFKAIENFYISNCYTALWYHIEKYCSHASIVWGTTKHPRTVEMAKAFDKCHDFRKWIQYNQNSLQRLCDNTINMKNYLTQVIPHPNSPSHKSSQRKLELIIDTAITVKEQLKFFEKTTSSIKE